MKICGISKIVTTIVSTFTSYYMHLWPSFFPGTPLSPPLPSFDGRAVQYPSMGNLRDYMSWRQVDCTLIVPFPVHVHKLVGIMLRKHALMRRTVTLSGCSEQGHINNLHN